MKTFSEMQGKKSRPVNHDAAGMCDKMRGKTKSVKFKAEKPEKK